MAAKILIVMCFAAAHANIYENSGLTPYGGGSPYDSSAGLNTPYLPPSNSGPYAPFTPNLSYNLGLSHPVIKPVQPSPSAASFLYPFPQAPISIPIEAYAPTSAAYSTPHVYATTPGYAQSPLSYALGALPAERPQDIPGTGNYRW